MFDSFRLISAEEVGTDGHQLAWSEGPRPVFEERDVNEPENKRERDESWEVMVGGWEGSYLNPARCLLYRFSVVVRSPALHKGHSKDAEPSQVINSYASSRTERYSWSNASW